MASDEEIRDEIWWDREIVTPELDWLADELCRRTGRPRTAAGTKGNTAHRNGGHRSQEWILKSRFCTDRDYTVQTGLTDEQLRHIAACDFTPGSWGTSTNRQLVAQQTRRLWDAAKRGELDGWTQVEGTLDGRNPVGLNVRTGTTFRPDSSHLDHWHLTGDRRRMRDSALMARTVNIALGTTGGGTVYGTVFEGTKGDAARWVQQRCRDIDPKALPKYGVDNDWGGETTGEVKRLFGGDGKKFGPDQFVVWKDKTAEIERRRIVAEVLAQVRSAQLPETLTLQIPATTVAIPAATVTAKVTG